MDPSLWEGTGTRHLQDDAPPGSSPLPLDDPFLRDPSLDLAALARHWSAYGSGSPMGAEEMRGAEARARRLGVSGAMLMEHAGVAVAAAIRALAVTAERPDDAMTLVLCGGGNNGGDGCVAARHLAVTGRQVVVALIATASRPGTSDAARNWERLSDVAGVVRLHCPSERDVRILMAGTERAAVIVDALLGSGVRGPLRDPIRTAVGLIGTARSQSVPILAIDTPTAVDLTSGAASDPVVRAHVTVTFHRPKVGLTTRTGAMLAGRVLVAPIGIPAEADRG